MNLIENPSSADASRRHDSRSKPVLPADAKLKRPVVLLSCLLALLIPLTIAIYWPLYSVSSDFAIVLLRPGITLSSLLIAMLWYYAPATAVEVRGACALGLFSVALLVPSLAGTDPLRSLAVWIKLVTLCGIALLLARALRHEGTAKSFGVALIFAAAIVGAFTVFTYLRFMGWSLPTYKSTREFKGIAETNGIPLNAIPFTSVFSFLAGMCLVRPNRFLWSLGFVLFLISSVLTGSRAPLAVLLLSGCVLLLINAFRSRRLAVRLSAYLLTATVVVGMAVLLPDLSFKQMSSLTEGRWDLWFVACKKFAQNPLLGFGYNSWQDDLVSMLPGEYRLTGYISKHIIGGYHNEYLTVLAEQGLIGFVPAMIVVCFLFSLCWKSAFRQWSTWHNGQWALFSCLFLLFRAAFEVPGLFGYGNEPADFLAYIFIAIMISRFSMEEDFVRSAASSWDSAAVPLADGSAHEWTKAASLA